MGNAGRLPGGRSPHAKRTHEISIHSKGRALPKPIRADHKIANPPFAAEEQTKFNTKGEDNMLMTSDQSPLTPCPERAATRPLERVEMDTWRVDLLKLFADAGLPLSAKERENFGLNGVQQPWYLSHATCAVTHCILAMRLSQTAPVASTVQTMEMITRDKGIWADAVGALSPWHMYGLPERLVTDCGTEYVSIEARAAARDLGIVQEHAPAGFPQMQASIARLFMTLGVNLRPRLLGRTFDGMIREHSLDPARSVLTTEDLCTALIRWVVDIHHQQPNARLHGETPAQCWDRLNAQYGVAVPPDMFRRRIAFGTRMTRTLTKGGITILGVRYKAEELAVKMVGKVGALVDVRWHGDDIGAIAVRIDDEWIEVPAVTPGCDGVSVQTLIAARRAIIDRDKRPIVLLVDDQSEDRLKREEECIFVGFIKRVASEQAPL